MKKLFLLFIPLLLVIAYTVYLYLNHNTTSCSSPNDYLGTLSYAVQIGYNICYLIIALAVLIIANYQLNRTREATTIPSLTGVSEKINGVYIRQKRKELAELILANSSDNLDPLKNNRLTDWLNDIPNTNQRKLSENEIRELAVVKNKFEVVAYEFEILGYYHENKIYSANDIYELFSYELQRYWLLFEAIGFIKYLRDKTKGGEHDFYNKFEKLYNASINHEITNGDWLIRHKKNKIKALKKEKLSKIGIFLIEESLMV